MAASVGLARSGALVERCVILLPLSGRPKAIHLPRQTSDRDTPVSARPRVTQARQGRTRARRQQTGATYKYGTSESGANPVEHAVWKQGAEAGITHG